MHSSITNESTHYTEYLLSVCILYIYTMYYVFLILNTPHPYCPMQATATCISVTQCQLLASNVDELHCIENGFLKMKAYLM